MVVGLLLSGCILAQVKRTHFLIRHTKIVCKLLHFCSIKTAGRVEVGFVNLSHLVWALVIVMLAGRKREGHGDKPKKHTYGGGVLVVWVLGQCGTVVGLPVPLSLVWRQQQMPVTLLCDPHTRRRDVLFITLDPEKDTGSLSDTTEWTRDEDFLCLAFTQGINS